MLKPEILCTEGLHLGYPLAYFCTLYFLQSFGFWQQQFSCGYLSHENQTNHWLEIVDCINYKFSLHYRWDLSCKQNKTNIKEQFICLLPI